jgi:hypothetical protein
MMKTTFLAAAVTIAAATMGHAGADPVVPGVPLTITTVIQIPSANAGGQSRGGLPSFFSVVPPSSPGGSFSFNLTPPNRESRSN